MLILQVQKKIQEGREMYCKQSAESGDLVIMPGYKRASEILESEIRHPLLPDNAYFTVLPDFELLENCPPCELHFNAIGTWEQIMKAISYALTKLLRRSDLVTTDGKHLVSDAKLGLFRRRLEYRIKSLLGDETMLNLPPLLIEAWTTVFDHTDNGAKMTGDNNKIVMLLLPFLVRDLITPEVRTYCTDLAQT